MSCECCPPSKEPCRHELGTREYDSKFVQGLQAENAKLRAEVEGLNENRIAISDRLEKALEERAAALLQVRELRNRAHAAIDYVGMANYAERQTEAHKTIDDCTEKRVEPASKCFCSCGLEITDAVHICRSPHKFPSKRVEPAPKKVEICAECRRPFGTTRGCPCSDSTIG